MGRPPLNIEPTTVRLSAGTGKRIAKLVPNYGAAAFIRDLVNRELDRREQDGIGMVEAASTGDIAIEDTAEILPSGEQQVSAPEELAARIDEGALLAPTPKSLKKRSTRAVSPNTSAHPARGAWRSMRQNSRETGYPIVAEWEDFSVFEKDMGPMPPGAILVRRDHRQGWCRGNCAWGTKAEVNRNRPTNSRHTVNDQTKTLAEWARTADMDYRTLWMRVHRLGWSFEKAIGTPVAPVPAPARLKTERRSAKNQMPHRKKDPRYKSWKEMRGRCKKGGGTYAPEWEDFWIFCRDLGERPPGTVQLRRDVSKPYGPGNSYWGTKGEVSRMRSSVRRYMYGGLEMTVPALAQAAGINHRTLSARLAKGKSLEEALAPVIRPISSMLARRSSGSPRRRSRRRS